MNHLLKRCATEVVSAETKMDVQNFKTSSSMTVKDYAETL